MYSASKMFTRTLPLLTLMLLIIAIHLSAAEDVVITTPIPTPPPSQSPSSSSLNAATLSCDSIEIRALSDFAAIRNCTRILGHVRLVNLQLSDNLADNISTNIIEINGYLLVHRVHGLSTLAHIFPQLTLIRGRQLLFDRYALVVYENRNLLNLGLTSLLRVQVGNIRIESNPVLCYVHTVNWVQLLGNNTHQHFSLKNNKPSSECPLCGLTNLIDDDSEDPEVNVQHCWDFGVLQQRLGGISTSQKCPPSCNIRGCDENGHCCAQNCLSDCSETSCSLCANFREQRRCVDSCSDGSYEYQQSECITTAVCLQLGLIPHGNACLERCPSNHVLSRNGFGQPICNLTCAGAYVVHGAVHLESLKGCSTIQGSLTIELEDVHSKISDLEHALQNITEITGFLKVVSSPQLMTLQFLPKLHTIRGEDLIDDKYALYVVDNYHLTEIWAPNQNVAILKGRIYFHINPRLCYEKIKALQPSIKSAMPMTIADVSQNSNGEHVVCESTVKTLNVSIEDFNATAVRLKLAPMSSDNKLSLIGYLYHFKEAPEQNVTLFDGRHGCGHDDWRMDISPNQNVRHILSPLKPYTQYAFFVKTLTMKYYHAQMDAYSPIKYFRTLPSKAGPVAKLYYHSASTTQIIVHWWPPRLPNGIIEKYILSYEKVKPKHQNTTLSHKNEGNADNNAKPCQCTIVNPEESGAIPDEQKYYRPFQVIYEEAIPDLIFVAKSVARRRQKRSEHSDITNATNSDKNFDNSTVSMSPSFVDMLDMDPQTTHVLQRRAVAKYGGIVKSPPSADPEEEKRRDEEGYRAFTMIRERMEKEALMEQDTGMADFPILKPRPLCAQSNPSLAEQLQHNCQTLEEFEGISVPGNLHSYTLDQLEPEVSYRITVRACAADVVNGCGVEKVIYAETISKPVSKFLRGLKPFD